MTSEKNRTTDFPSQVRWVVAYETALDAGLERLNQGIQAVTVQRVCRTAGRSRGWATENGIGTRQELLQAITRREVIRIITELQNLETPITTRRRLRALLQTLLGDPDTFQGRLHILRMGADVLAEPLSAVIGGGRYQMALGSGILGVLVTPLRTPWRPTYWELLAVAEEMSWAVSLFEVTTTKIRKP